MSRLIAPRRTAPRLAAALAVLAIVGVSVTTAAAPASATAGLVPPTIVGGIDHASVVFHDTDDTQALHVTGWAANLVVPSQNGLNGMLDIELTAAPAAGGAAQTIGWAQGRGSSLPRPDVAKAYPQLGPNHGWDVEAAFAHSGAWKICARVWDRDAAMPSSGWIQLACTTVTLVGHRPAYRPALPATVSYAQAVVPTTPAAPPAGSTVSYQWFQYPYAAPSRAAISGATSGQYTPGIAQTGHYLSLRTVMQKPGTTPVEQWTSDEWVKFGDYSADRLSGPDRYATSVAVSQRAFPDASTGAPVAYLVSGLNYPDALSAGAAAAKQGGTILMTQPEALPASVVGELTRLHPAIIVVVGGAGAVSDAVLARARALSFAPAVVRVSGVDRYSTSRAVARYAFGDSAPTVFLATGRAAADALVAGPAAASSGVPLLLTDGSRQRADPATAAELARLGTSQVRIIGGSGVVTPGVASTLGAAIAVTRVAGSDRFATAAAIAATFPASAAVYLANATRYPDALTVSVLAGRDHAPLFLTQPRCVPQSALAAMVKRNVVRGTVVGGDGVVAWSVKDPSAC